MNMLTGYYARLGQGDKAALIIEDIFRRLVKPNMTSVMSDETSMWCGTWELDGNTGLTDAIAEMLLQSCPGEVTVLPALPDTWADGEPSGVTIVGGHKIDIIWRDKKLKNIILYPVVKEQIKIYYGSEHTVILLLPGKALKLG